MDSIGSVDSCIPFHDLVGESFIGVHSLDRKQTQIELFLFLAAEKELGSLVSIQTCSLLSERGNTSLLLSVHFVKKLVVFDWNQSTLGRIVTINILRLKEFHEAHVNEVFHFPDPLPAPRHSKLFADSFLITSHEKGHEIFLRNISQKFFSF